MLQWFIKFTEFSEFPFHLGKTPMCCIHVFSMQGKILVTAGTKTTPKSDGPFSDDGNFNQENRFILHGNSCIN